MEGVVEERSGIEVGGFGEVASEGGRERFKLKDEFDERGAREGRVRE